MQKSINFFSVIGTYQFTAFTIQKNDGINISLEFDGSKVMEETIPLLKLNPIIDQSVEVEKTISFYASITDESFIDTYDGRDPQYSLERELYFHEKDFDFNVYGNGWTGFKHWRGLLPPLDIGRLYTSAKSGIAIIAKRQREHGMINNRYTEMGICGIPIITYNYDTVDWYGAEHYLNFISTVEELKDKVSDIKNNDV